MDVRRLLLVLPLVLLACSDEDEPTRQAARTTSTTAVAEPALEDGRHFAFVEAVRADGAVEVDVDLAQWLSGEEANRAAEEDGAIEPGEGVPNDYYIRNVNERVRTLPVAADATFSVVRLPDCCESMDLASRDAWLAWYRHPDHQIGLGGPNGSWWLTVRNGVVIGIEEQYRP